MPGPHALDPDAPRVRLAATLDTLTAAHLLFPTAIMTVAVVGFVLGRGMSAWVLSVAAGITVLGLRAFSASWPQAGLMAALAAVVHAIAGLVSVTFPDNSWDGLRYHQEAILRLAAGWNPLFEDAARYGPGTREALFINHYPRMTWITGAAVLLSTGHVEAGKLFNLTLMVAAGGQVTSALLRLTRLPVTAAAGVALLFALNPVVIYQSTTFYVDGALASLLTVVVAGLTIYVAASQWRALGVVLLAACLVINLKFTGLGYAVVLLALVVPIVWRWHGFPAACGMAAAATGACAVAILFLGYSPYMQNLREHGDPFYPVRGAPELVGLGTDGAFRPVNLNDKDRVTRFLVSNFSRSESVRPPEATRLKFPLSIGPQERRGTYGADLEAGGFGPLYGALLLLTALGGLALVAHPVSRYSGGVVLLIGGCVAVSMFIHSETWWARYVPQAWLLPLLVAVPSLCSPRRSLRWYLGCVLAALASANALIVGANVGWNRIAYASATRTVLREMAAAPQPVSVYLDPFRSLRQRLFEAGVEFTIVDTPPESSSRRHPIPAPGGVFWVN